MPTRDSQPQFQAGPVQYDGSSSTRRPDAISSDYLTVFSPGPIAISDPSQGLLVRPWRARVEGGTVYLSRGPEWEEETELFTFSGPPILECDLAFDQNGAAVLVAQRATGDEGANEVWIYYFDPLLAESVFVSFGAGRTPRVCLDNPTFTQSSDLLVFYIRGDSLRYRVQSDLYTVEETLVELAIPNQTFVEKAYRGLGYRVQVILSVRDTSTFRYSLDSLSSPLYDVPVQPDGVGVGFQATEVYLQQGLVPGVESEGHDVGMAVLAISVVSTEQVAEPEGNDIGITILSILVAEGSYRATAEAVEAGMEIRVVAVRQAILPGVVPEGAEVGMAIGTIVRT